VTFSAIDTLDIKVDFKLFRYLQFEKVSSAELMYLV